MRLTRYYEGGTTGVSEVSDDGVTPLVGIPTVDAAIDAETLASAPRDGSATFWSASADTPRSRTRGG